MVTQIKFLNKNPAGAFPVAGPTKVPSALRTRLGGKGPSEVSFDALMESHAVR